MGPGFKYHVVTIAAIFFALTVGLVVGSLYVSPQVADGQKRALRNLQSTLDKDILARKIQVERYKKFVDNVTPLLLRGKLTGRTISILQIGDYPEARARVQEALRMANAQVLSVITIEKTWDRPDELLNPLLAEVRGQNPRFPSQRDDLAQTLADALAHGQTEADSMVRQMEQANLLTLEAGADLSTPVHYVVLLAGSRGGPTLRPERVDKPLILALQKHDVQVVMAEPEETKVSDSDSYHALDLNLPIIDRVNSDIGGSALVFALSEDRPSDEAKPTASHSMLP